ncbi:hypothetical protein FGM00_02120 [Aggregatimonas sangjinii]|uniref:Uncharacterized protein n=1 Tax=Aggregatimonas sangjinii TaxID=2583587 RepID=A0A5B7SPM0_9FLAO|nr:hypothetical protein FGM00_02120 [Aggregatimonas sangjinii]
MKKPIYTITIIVTVLAIISNGSDEELARIFSKSAEAIGLSWRIHPISEVCINAIMLSEDCVPFSPHQSDTLHSGEFVLITLENAWDGSYPVVEQTIESDLPCAIHAEIHLPENQLSRVHYRLPSKGNNSEVQVTKSTIQSQIP